MGNKNGDLHKGLLPRKPTFNKQGLAATYLATGIYLLQEETMDPWMMCMYLTYRIILTYSEYISSGSRNTCINKSIYLACSILK